MPRTSSKKDENYAQLVADGLATMQDGLANVQRGLDALGLSPKKIRKSPTKKIKLEKGNVEEEEEEEHACRDKAMLEAYGFPLHSYVEGGHLGEKSSVKARGRSRSSAKSAVKESNVATLKVQMAHVQCGAVPQQQLDRSDQQSAPFNYNVQQNAPLDYSGQQSAQFNYGGQQSVPLNYEGRQSAQFNYDGRQSARFNYGGQQRGQQSVPFNYSGQQSAYFNYGGQQDVQQSTPFNYGGQQSGQQSAPIQLRSPAATTAGLPISTARTSDAELGKIMSGEPVVDIAEIGLHGKTISWEDDGGRVGIDLHGGPHPWGAVRWRNESSASWKTSFMGNRQWWCGGAGSMEGHIHGKTVVGTAEEDDAGFMDEWMDRFAEPGPSRASTGQSGLPQFVISPTYNTSVFTSAAAPQMFVGGRANSDNTEVEKENADASEKEVTVDDHVLKRAMYIYSFSERRASVAIDSATTTTVNSSTSYSVNHSSVKSFRHVLLRHYASYSSTPSALRQLLIPPQN